MGGGSRPGITAKLKVASIAGNEVTFTFVDPEDAAYFEGKVGNEFVAKFHPAADSDRGGTPKKQE